MSPARTVQCAGCQYTWTLPAHATGTERPLCSACRDRDTDRLADELATLVLLWSGGDPGLLREAAHVVATTRYLGERTPS